VRWASRRRHAACLSRSHFRGRREKGPSKPDLPSRGQIVGTREQAVHDRTVSTHTHGPRPGAPLTHGVTGRRAVMRLASFVSFGITRTKPLMDLGERATRFRFLVRYRAGQFTEAFDAVLSGAGIEVVKIPPQSPRANAHAERWVRTDRAEVTDRMLIAGPRHLRSVLDEYAAHDNQHRPHRVRNLRPPDCDDSTTASVWRK
jgi:putative transposase